MAQVPYEVIMDEKIETDESSLNSTNSGTTDSSNGTNSSDKNSKLLKYGVLRELPLKHVFMDDENVEKFSTPLTWSNIDGTTFNVRYGPNYKKTGKKGPSANGIYNVFAVDAYKSPIKINKIWQFVDLREKINQYYSINNGESKMDNSINIFSLLPPVLIINFMIPNYSPSMLGTDCTDGDGFSLVIYSEISQESLDYLIKFSKNKLKFDQLPSSLQLLSKFICAADTRDSSGKYILDNEKQKEKEKKKHLQKSIQFKNNNNFELNKKEIESLLSSFKIILRLMNYSKTQLSGSIKPILKQYNGKPFIAKTSSMFYYEKTRYFAIDIDTHIFGKFARKSLGMIRNHMSSVIFDGAFVIEGKQDNQLPEQVLCTTRISKIAIKSAKQFPKQLLRDYEKRKEQRLHLSHKFDINSNHSAVAAVVHSK